MQNGKQLRLLLPMTGVVVGFSFMAQTASAQQPGGPGQEDRRPRRSGNFGKPGNQNEPGRPGGRQEAAPPPPGGKYDEDETAPPVATAPLAPGVTRVAVVFSGGHDTDPRDGGRPVVLVANGLGVAPEVFREAFSHVRPARTGNEPEPAQVQQNKSALLNALGRYGINNDRIDTVSNYYRYVRSRNELWTHTPAVANALIKSGVLVGFEVVRHGSGYTSSPSVSVPDVRTGSITVKLAFGKNLATNGSIASITTSQNEDRGYTP